MTLPHIVIIILHYKNLENTMECLKSLQKLDYPSFSVIVVNNDILEHKTILEADYGDFVKIVQNSQNLGFCEGNNVGIRHALADSRTGAVLLLNNDTVVEPNFLKEMITANTDMVAPRLMQYHDKDKVDNLGIVLMSSGLPFNRTNENQKLFCPSGACALYTRELLEAVFISRHPEPALGGSDLLANALNYEIPQQTRNDGYYFDPLFFAYCEDLDLGWRARNAGFEAAYAKDAIVYHKGSAIHGKLSDFAVCHTYRNLIWTQFKNFPLALLLWQLPWLGAGWFFIIALYFFKARPGVILRALWDGMTGLRFILNRRSQAQKNRQAAQKQILSWFSSGLFPRSFVKL